VSNRKESETNPNSGAPADTEGGQSRPDYYYDDATGYEKYEPEADDEGDVPVKPDRDLQ